MSRTIHVIAKLMRAAPHIKYTLNVKDTHTSVMQGFKSCLVVNGNEHDDAAKITEWLDRHCGPNALERAEQFIRDHPLPGERAGMHVGLIKLVKMLNESDSPFRYEMVAPVDDESVSIYAHSVLIAKIPHHGNIDATKRNLLEWVGDAHEDGFLDELLPEGSPSVSPQVVMKAGLGVFRLHWGDGGTSVCCISMEANGARCINIANWTWQGESVSVDGLATMLTKIELIARN